MTTKTTSTAKTSSTAKTTTKRPAPRKPVPAPEVVAAATRVMDALDVGAAGIPTIAVDEIHPHPHNPRRDLGDLGELTDSIRAHGVRQNLLVVPNPEADQGGYRVVIGHRRLAAARLAGLDRVPAVIDRDLDSAGQLQLMLLENIQRSELSPVEEAMGYQGLLDLGLSRTGIARATGRAVATVKARLKLVGLPEAAREAVHTGQATLADAAALAELEGDPKALANVVQHLGTPNFRYYLNRARGEIRERADAARTLVDLTARCMEEGWSRLPDDPDEGETIPDGFTRVLWLSRWELATTSYGRRRLEEHLTARDLPAGTAFRVDPETMVFELYRPVDAAPEPSPEEAAEQEARAARDAAVTALREATDAAAATRAEFVAGLLAGTHPVPKDSAPVLSAVLDLALGLEAEGRWRTGAGEAVYELLGVSPDPADHGLEDTALDEEIADAIDAAVTTRLAALSPTLKALALGSSLAEPIGMYDWRRDLTAAWYGVLETAGYPISDAERSLLDEES